MSPEDLKKQVAAQFKRRKFAAGLALAILDFLRKLNAPGRFSSMEELLAEYPKQDRTHAGKTANTLIVAVGDTTLSLRPFYNHYEKLFRVEHKRFGYPNAAPHATQAWTNYTQWFEAILQMPIIEQDDLRQWVINFVLEQLPSHEVDPSSIRPLSRPFSRLLHEFPLAAASGEKHGACFQGVVFAYIRADAPHLFLEVAKVGAGSKRLQRVGDIDGWQGERLVITVECKSFEMDLDAATELGAFLGEAKSRKALATVAALSFTQEAKDHLTDQDVRLLDMDRLKSLIDLWDPLKQQIAYDGFTYYAHHVEKNAPLMERLAAFTAKLAADEADAGSPTEKEPDDPAT
jgi:hypothetical protein